MQRTSVYISIPKSWADAQGICRYSDIDICLNRDNSLKITKHKEDE